MESSFHISIRRALLRWFRRNARPLPWRAQPSPYGVWISEIMLQQTQIATVIPYYERFLTEFPTVEALAAAPLERVLELWSGLGYYRRARHLHESAQQIVGRFDGRFPASYDQVTTLPGIGDYTARAILSIASGQPFAVLDGNVARVMARFFALRGNLHRPRFRRAAELQLGLLLSRRHPGDFNQAMMELGQRVCLPKHPRCDACPLALRCEARRLGQPEGYPSPRPRRSTEVRHLAAAVIYRGSVEPHARRKPRDSTEPAPSDAGSQVSAPRSRTSRSRVLLVRGLDEGLLGDLWNFPSAFGASRAEALLRLAEKLGSLEDARRKHGPQRTLASVSAVPDADRLRPSARPFARLRHGITYRSIQVELYACPAPGHLELSPVSPWRWFRLEEIDGAAVSQLARKIRATISRRRGM